MIAQILCIGVSDSSAGTGIQADIKTIQAFGAYAATVVTAVSVQNTQNVYDVFPIPAMVVRQQIGAVMDDMKPTVIKSGMLCDESIINAVGDFLDGHKTEHLRVVIDPVMTSRIGKMLLDKPARDALKRRMMIYADIITPNLREAEYLTGLAVNDIDSMKHAAEMLQTLGASTVIIKGGSLEMDKVYNVLADDKGIEIYEQPRINSKATHGAGTTLSAGIAAGIAQGLPIRTAFENAQDFLTNAIINAEQVGGGYGPVNHNFRVKAA